VLIPRKILSKSRISLLVCTIPVGRMSYGLNRTLQMCAVKIESGLGYKSSQVRVHVLVQQKWT